MAGPAIRSYELATRLSADWDVTLLALQDCDPGWQVPNVNLLVRDPLTWRGLKALASDHDVVLTQPLRLQLQHALHVAGRPVVIDAYVPNLMEQVAVRDDVDPALDRARSLNLKRARLELKAAARIGTAYLCAGEHYRDFLMGVLAMEGRITRDSLSADPSAKRLIVSAPFGISDEAAHRNGDSAVGPLRAELGIGRSDTVFIWAGGIWDWLDPLTPIRGLARAVKESDATHPVHSAHLVFLGVDHPNPEVKTAALQQISELVEQLKIADRVHVRRGWVPYDERGAWLVDADVGICAHQDSLETRYSWRQRLLDHIWAGLPTICGSGDELGKLIADSGAGVQLPSGDVDSWAKSFQAATDKGWRSERMAGTSSLRTAIDWSMIAQDVSQVLRDSTSSPHPTHSPFSLLPSYVRVQTARLGVGTAARKAIRSLTRR